MPVASPQERLPGKPRDPMWGQREQCRQREVRAPHLMRRVFSAGVKSRL